MKNLILILIFLFVPTVSAQEITVRYILKTTVGYRSSSQTLSIHSTERKMADGVQKANTSKMLTSVNSRGVENETTNVSEKKEKSQEVAQDEQKKALNSSPTPFKKYLTEQGTKTREIVLAHLSQYYSGDDLIAIDNLIKAESGYKYDAINESGAGGLGQALPYTKMGCGLTEADIICQTQWMIGYINRRYGSPTSAWNFWLSRVPIDGKDVGNWY